MHVLMVGASTPSRMNPSLALVSESVTRGPQAGSWPREDDRAR
jgi:hypothetical protein